jgi:hypothetical protein
MFYENLCNNDFAFGITDKYRQHGLELVLELFSLLYLEKPPRKHRLMPFSNNSPF